MLRRVYPLSLSALAHGTLIVLLLVFWVVHPVTLQPLRSVDVQVLSEDDYRRVTTLPSEPAPFAPAATPQTAIAAPVVPPKQTPAPVAPPAAPAGMTHATTLFATAMLKEPASRDVRATLPTLDRYERITQLCNMESTEQIRRALKGSNPDVVSAAAFGETTLSGLTLSATGASYRSKSKWYALRFECTVLPDLSGVADYRFSTGAAIPKDQWEEHNLNAADEDDE